MNRKIRISFYGKDDKAERCVISFYRDMKTEVGGVFVKLWAKGSRLYFLPAKPAVGTLTIGKNFTIQISRQDYLEELKKFEGIHYLKYDNTTRYYYVESGEIVEAGEATTDEIALAETPENVESIEKLDPEEKAEPAKEVKTARKTRTTRKTKAGGTKRTYRKSPATAIEPIPKRSDMAKETEEEKNEVEEVLQGLIYEALDDDDLAGAKALLKAIRKFAQKKKDETSKADAPDLKVMGL